jgi:hypothetical protein
VWRSLSLSLTARDWCDERTAPTFAGAKKKRVRMFRETLLSRVALPKGPPEARIASPEPHAAARRSRSSVPTCARWSSRRVARSCRSCRWPRAARARAARDEPSAGAAVAVVRPAVAPARVEADAAPPALPAGKPRGRRVESDVRLPDGAGTSARTRKARRVAAFPRPRPSAMRSSRETAMSHRHLLRTTRRSASRSSWRGAGCAAVARPRS